VENGLAVSEEFDAVGGDGRVDVWRFYDKGCILAEERDRNGDDRIDCRANYSVASAELREIQRDTDFNGDVDLHIQYMDGYRWEQNWDRNHDGTTDFSFTVPRGEFNRAKAILDEAGWKPGPDGIRAKGGLRLSFSNATTAGNKLREQTQALLQQNWRAIGVDMQINNMPAAVIWGEFYVKSKFETLLVGIQASVGDDPDCLNRIHSKYIAAKTGSGRNVSQYENPQVDRLLEDGVREIDRAKRRAIYQKLQEVIRADLAYLPIFSYVRIEGVKQGIVNYRPNPYTQVNNWNMHEWGWRA